MHTVYSWKHMLRGAVACAVIAASSMTAFAGAPSYLEQVDPQLRPALEQNSSLDFNQAGVLEDINRRARSLVGSPDLPKDEAVHVYDVYIPRAGDSEALRLRIYKPVQAEESLPGIYWIHGGGFLFGVPEQDEAQSIRFAKDVGAVVVSVDYRLAPKYPYPAAIDDSYAGLKWFFDNAAALGVDHRRIAVAGASAGGNLCAAVALMARDKGEIRPVFQMPLYPMLDDRMDSPASREVMDMRVWNNVSNVFAWKAYIGDAVGTDKATPYMAPARAENLSGLPPAYICVSTLDPFRDDTIRYAQRLAQAGVPVEFHLYPRAYHAFEAIAKGTAYSERAIDEYVRVLNEALHP